MVFGKLLEMCCGCLLVAGFLSIFGTQSEPEEAFGLPWETFWHKESIQRSTSDELGSVLAPTVDPRRRFGSPWDAFGHQK